LQEKRHVGFALLQHRQPRGALGHALHDQPLDAGHAPQVSGVRLQHDLHAGVMADELVWARATGVLSESVVTDAGGVLLRHDDPRRRGGGPVEGHEIRPRLFEHESHHERIHDIYLTDAQSQFLGPGALVSLEAELHVFARDVVAVVELESPAQLELIDEAVWTLRPRLRHTVAHLLSRQRAHQRVVKRIQDAERRDLRWSRRWIEPARGNDDGPGDNQLSRWWRRASRFPVGSNREHYKQQKL